MLRTCGADSPCSPRREETTRNRGHRTQGVCRMVRPRRHPAGRSPGLWTWTLGLRLVCDQSRCLWGLASRATGITCPGREAGVWQWQRTWQEMEMGAVQGPELVPLVLMSKIYAKLFTNQCPVILIFGSGDSVTSAGTLSGMALAPWGQILFCSSLRNNCHRFKASGGPKAQSLFLPPSSVDFSSCFFS